MPDARVKANTLLTELPRPVCVSFYQFVACFLTCPLLVSESGTKKQATIEEKATTGETISDESSDSEESFFGKIKRKIFG